MTGPIAMPSPQPHPDDKHRRDQPLHYVEAGLLVYTAAFHLKRGHCCGSGCRHCPYEPRHTKGNTKVRR